MRTTIADSYFEKKGPLVARQHFLEEIGAMFSECSFYVSPLRSYMQASGMDLKDINSHPAYVAASRFQSVRFADMNEETTSFVRECVSNCLARANGHK